MNVLGRHLLIELQDCDKEVLNNLDFLREAMVAAAIACGATVMGESFHHFKPQGVSGLVLITGSHICIHTWPEYCYAAVDIFIHSDSFQPEEAAQLLIERLESKHPSIVELKRGA